MIIKFNFYKTDHNLSRKLSKAGISGFKPFLFLISPITMPVFDVASNGSPGSTCQCENTHYGKAFPAVAPLKAAVNPKLSETGKNALTKFKGVPTS
jgi:hypothetical protein